MNKTLRISFALKNTYRVNSILYSIKQIPILKKILPDALYGVQGLKIFAYVVAILWEVGTVFIGKLLYLAGMIIGMMNLYSDAIERQGLFMHMLLFLTVLGAFLNTYIFNPTKDKYYALILMRMDARAYTLVEYTYAILKVIIGFLPFAVIFGMSAGLPLWQCLLIPFFVAGCKMIRAAYALWRYEKTGTATNENLPGKIGWILVFVLLAAAYGLPAVGIVVHQAVSVGIMAFVIAGGLVSVWKIRSFVPYRDMYQEILVQAMNQMDAVKKIAIDQNRKIISADTKITSNRRGFEYLNELFIKRHQKILWKSARKTAAICLAVVLGFALALYLKPGSKALVNRILLTYLPYFVFIMYAINRGTGFTRALFMNCDHSLLTYSFYKQPRLVLKLFQIRLREIIKINLLPALVIGGGMTFLLYLSGGTEDPVNYAVIFVSILCMGTFFSVHYLTIYYLLQPYNAGTEVKSATYQIVLTVTYLVCFFMMQVKMPTLIFGIMCIGFCVLYFIVASVLVYRLAPKTFRLRS